MTKITHTLPRRPKQINDTYGHLYGDLVLNMFAVRLERAAQRLQNGLPGIIQISIGHPSGEEFLISLFGNASREILLDWADIFRTDICDRPLPSEEEWTERAAAGDLSAISRPPLHERTVSASVGVAFRGVPVLASEDKSNTIEAFLDEADTALYRAKAAGRNQVIAFDDILSQCGLVLEHDTTTQIVSIDIGQNVGVSIGQEFKVYTPAFCGKKKFLVSDGRTTRTIGTRPRVEHTRITAFDVQPDISFAYISDTSTPLPSIEVGAHLEAIPTGSISHLLTGSSKYFPAATHNAQVGDSSAVQEFVKENSPSGKIFAIVFRLASEQEYLRRHGSAALNAALANLFKDVTRIFHTADATSVLDTTSICIVGRNIAYKEEDVKSFAEQYAEALSELKLRVGVFCHADIEKSPEDDHSALNPANAIEFARYAASDYAATSDSRVVHFKFQTASAILSARFDARENKQGLVDYEKLRALGVESASLQNRAGLFCSSLGNHKRASDLYNAAIKNKPNVLIYKTNYATALDQDGQRDDALLVFKSLTPNQISSLPETHEFAAIVLADLLAKAKINGLPTFDQGMFDKVAMSALKLSPSKDTPRYKRIEKAISMK